jgi:hypothetical protein
MTVRHHPSPLKTVSMRDVIMQPGSKTMGPPMENAMVCHVTEGELRVEQDLMVLFRMIGERQPT